MKPRRQPRRRSARRKHEDVGGQLRRVVDGAHNPPGGLGSEIAALLANAGLNFEAPELRGYTIKSPF